MKKNSANDKPSTPGKIPESSKQHEEAQVWERREKVQLEIDRAQLNWKKKQNEIQFKFERVEHARRNLECLFRSTEFVNKIDQNENLKKQLIEAINKNVNILANFPNIKV